jgi:hypothetical protein
MKEQVLMPFQEQDVKSVVRITAGAHTVDLASPDVSAGRCMN